MTNEDDLVYVREDSMNFEGCTNADKIRYGVFRSDNKTCLMWFTEIDHGDAGTAKLRADILAKGINHAHKDATNG